MKAIILLGAPGSGKGTTAEKIEAESGYAHVSTGDMLRSAVKNETEVGKLAESYMKRGELVPDDVMIKVIEERLDSGGSDAAYMFDGYPRTVAQADLLESSLKGREGVLEVVVFLDAPREVLISRLTGRRVCRNCGTSYHVVNIPPKQEGVCDSCGGELYQRPDDQEDTIINRLDVYNQQTESLVDRYEKQGILVRVDSAQGADNLATEVAAILKAGPRSAGH
ncbi:MAG: adenylate kinase [Kiritimatiellae bacterium]|nr:adenylate kinase [Kiritimatiellia bacterium]